MRTRTTLLAAIALTLAACSGGSGAPTTTDAPSTTLPASTSSQPSTTTTLPDETTTTIDPGQPLVLPTALDRMPDTWEERFFIPYGETPDTLGTYLGGDGEGIQIGPDFGAQAPDGSWWFLDTAKLRLAHFSESEIGRAHV